MTKYHTLTKATLKLIISAGALALIAGLSLNMAPQAFAFDCLLDTNNDGDADTNVDTDGGADSSGSSFRLACGQGAMATGPDSTALGRSASAAGISSTAVGYFANFAGAAGDYSTALGSLATARGVNAIAIGADTADGGFVGADAQGANSIVIGTDATDGGFASSTVIGTFASAAGSSSTALGRSTTAGAFSTALGASASAAGFSSTALGRSASAAGISSTALGRSANAAGISSTALGYAANDAGAAGDYSTALGSYSSARGVNAIAIGADTIDAGLVGANAQGANSIVIGTDAGDGGFFRAVVIGTNATATETDQVILQDASTFTILGNGNVGLGTATPAGNLDIDSGGAVDTTLLLSNTGAQWELKNKNSTGRLTFKNLTAGGVPFKLGPTAVNALLSVGTATDDLVEVRGDFDVTGILTTGGPTCGGGCDAVFDDDYDLPTIEEHAAQMFANKHLPAVGPTIPHAPINISEQYGKLLNELEKAHIYIAKVNEEKRALEVRVDQQDLRLSRLEKRLE